MTIATSNEDAPLAGRPPSNFQEFSAPGTKLFYEFTPLDKLPGKFGDELRLSTIVGVVHLGERAEKVFAVRLTIADVKGCIEGTCRLDYDELNALIGFVNSLCRCRDQSEDNLAVALITFESREGFVLEVDRRANIRIGKSRTVVHDRLGLEELLQILFACRTHLDIYRLAET